MIRVCPTARINSTKPLIRMNSQAQSSKPPTGRSRPRRKSRCGSGAPPAGYSNTEALGHVLYTDYVFPFEIAAVILLVAIVAAIALTLRRRKDTRHQDPSQQVKARRAERVRLVSMPAEKER